jgi:uncharacterized protein (DUF1778 family)
MEGPACSASPDQSEMIMHAAALVATGTAGFLVGGAAGAAAGVLAWTAVLIVWWQLRARNALALPGPTAPPQPSAYADIEDIVDRLDDVARERNWSIGKRFEIARLACENRTTTFDELERRYDRGIRSAPEKTRQNTPESPEDDESV